MSAEAEKPRTAIPKAVFITDIEAFLASNASGGLEGAMERFQTQHQQYKTLEASLAQRKRTLITKVPEMQSALDAIAHLKEKQHDSEPIRTQFELCDNLYATADIKPTSKVGLWLGANVMLEYDIDEAQTLLQGNLQKAQRNSDQLGEDLGFVKEQLTTMEVNIARLHNWGVAQKKKDKQNAAAPASSAAPAAKK
ncbi:prefoldin [Capsaspora owczarzaki ATCC 30864]|uniref:Prefoldin subunit 3 n=1 Tax=Capsaspora owczarzaki (strain ATCC 30864) TaxID=595528 RepID=A0A0D2WQ29_CAPO3|nr:prefoldin [Capsaspora owczarzaki ATCC 30864]KJE93660.1 prefoldin [Capsaspora owczarzaki ATCC 30864]|eukprot:XP_004348244.1 prefoldin [Capsaspora owczarzaki ATCC 30864]